MPKVILTIRSQEGTRQIPLAKGHLTIGRTDAADITIDDPGLSRVHASIHRAGDRVWILDEGSTNGSLVNGRKVVATGTPLSDQDQIAIGDGTTITIGISGHTLKPVEASSAPVDRSRLPQILGLALVVAVSLAIVGVGSRILSSNSAAPSGAKPRGQGQSPEPVGSDRPDEQGQVPARSDAAVGSTGVAGGSSNSDDSTAHDSPRPAAGGHESKKLYRQMGVQEQAAYVEQQSRHVADMIGKRPCTFTPEVLNLIKYWVDAYSRRVGNNQSGLWREDLRTVFRRATRYTPIIIREFRKKEINDVIGVYIPMIETEYNNICYENRAGAMGLFQFTGPTARGMGLNPADRCDVKKITPIAARYIADRLSEFGTDAVGVSLSIAGYNRSPDSVRRDLYNTIDPDNRERSFWTLVANKGKLDEWFQTENIAYVPRFFAAAIIGENPWDFGIEMNQLSTYTEGGDGG